MSFNENSFDNSINNSLNYNQLPVSSFDPLTHIPPKYDIYGYAKPPNQNNRYNIFSYLKNKKLHENKMLNQGIIEIYKK